MPQEIPLDVVYRVLDYTCNDTRTLRTCTLVNSAFLSYARMHLFRDIRMTSRNMLPILRLLTGSEDIANYIQRLRIYTSTHAIPPDNLAFGKLEVLHTLDLYLVSFTSIDHLCLLVASLPSLTSLTCMKVLLLRGGLTTGARDIVTLSPSIRPSQSLRTLVVMHEYIRVYVETALPLTTFATWLAQGPEPQTFLDLKLTLQTREEHTAWIPFIRTVAPGSQTLQLTAINDPSSTR
ncbi:hypothetical protein C8Q80DRAFT_434579 [Daedaleopsis nitida]|nr:hypothetical protein C8Q80DRAFT_434579 [Daedaleopsis nitida]